MVQRVMNFIEATRDRHNLKKANSIELYINRATPS